MVSVDKREKSKKYVKKHDQETAKDFLRVAIFIEIMQNCKRIHVDEHWTEWRLYCLFKAGHILNHLDEDKSIKRGNPFKKDKDLNNPKHPLVPECDNSEVMDDGVEPQWIHPGRETHLIMPNEDEEEKLQDSEEE